MNKRELLDVYYRMTLCRQFETRVAEQYTKGRVGGFCHLYSGEEAVAVGAIWNLRKDDVVIGSYRDHAYYLIRGGDPKKAMAELFGHQEGPCKGRGGSMHLFDRDLNFLGGYAIVAGECPIAVGLGLAIQKKKEDRVVLCFFGDGATNQGVFHEALNLAALYKLPIVWVCENNQYAIGSSVARSTASEQLARKAECYMPTFTVDGMDFFKMQSVAERAIAAARAGKGPQFIEAKCYRYRGHSMSDPGTGYRTKEEIAHWKKRDPIPKIKAQIEHDFEIGGEEFEKIDARVKKELDEAVRFAESGSELPKERLHDDVYAE